MYSLLSGIEKVIATKRNESAGRYDGYSLADVIHSYRFAAAIEVKNGISRHTGRFVNQVRSGVRYIKDIAEENTLVAGGISFIRNKKIDTNVVPDGLEFLLHTPTYRSRPLAEAIDAAFCYNVLNETERELLGDIRRVSRRYKIPIASFFNSGEEGHWELVRWAFGMTVKDLTEKIGGARGLIMELYTATIFRKLLSDGEIRVRHNYTIHGDQSDIDVLVLTQPDIFMDAILRLPQYGIGYTMSNNFIEKISKR